MLELAAAKGCNTFVTADVKYDRFLAAKELGVNLIDADHFCTENVVIPSCRPSFSSGFRLLRSPSAGVPSDSADILSIMYAAGMLPAVYSRPRLIQFW